MSFFLWRLLTDRPSCHLPTYLIVQYDAVPQVPEPGHCATFLPPQTQQKMASAPTTTPQLRIKPPAIAFGASDSVRNIRFLHPGYPGSDNVLLILPTLDSGGVHHETARVACAILADCRWDGYFSETPNGPQFGDTNADTILTASSYYFCVGTGEPQTDEPTHIPLCSLLINESGSTEPYPVVPSFDHFIFPSNLPPSWSASSAPVELPTSEQVPSRDQTCRVTNWALPLEIAHIVPAAQVGWWRNNNMALYARRPEASSETDCSENAILMRKDVHTLWDRHRFCIVPKSGRWVVHVLDNQASRELQDTYHNLTLQPLRQVSRYYLFARLALAILSEKNAFIKLAIRPRRVVLVDDNSEKAVATLASQVCRDRFGPSSRSKSRSHSPQKRSRTAAGVDEDDAFSNGGNHSRVGSRSAWEAEQWGEDLSEEEQRGRPLKRRRLPFAGIDDGLLASPPRSLCD